MSWGARISNATNEIVLFTLPSRKTVEKSDQEKMLIKTTLTNKSGNPEGLKKKGSQQLKSSPITVPAAGEGSLRAFCKFFYL